MPQRLSPVILQRQSFPAHPYINKLIEKTERAVWKEVQPKKKFELFQKLKGYKKEWEDLQRG